MLGRPASATRTGVDFRWIARSAGPFVVIVDPDLQVEVVDARDGSTVANYAFPVLGDPYHNVAPDLAGTYLYFATQAPDPGGLMRMRVDGTELVRIAPLPPREPEDYGNGGYAIRPDGGVVTLECPDNGGSASKPCRLYSEAAGAAPGGSTRPLRASTPPICMVLGATNQHLIVTTTPDGSVCFADGGQVPIKFLSIAFDDLAFASSDLDQNMDTIGYVDVGEAWPRLIGVAHVLSDGVPHVFWPYSPGVIQNLRTGTVRALMGTDDTFGTTWRQWSAVQVIGDWVQVEGVGRDFLLCRFATPESSASNEQLCPPDAGGLWNPRTRTLIDLPLGTFGNPSSFLY